MNKFIKTIAILAVTILALTYTIDFLRFPECYLTTWKYQLRLDLERGNEKAIEYYNERYIANGKVLFE